MELDEMDIHSLSLQVVRFKHSTRCRVSALMLDRFQRTYWAAAPRPVVYFLDLIAHRSLSNAIANRYGIDHRSPRVLLVHRARCVGNWSDGIIDLEETQHMLRSL